MDSQKFEKAKQFAAVAMVAATSKLSTDREAALQDSNARLGAHGQIHSSVAAAGTGTIHGEYICGFLKSRADALIEGCGLVGLPLDDGVGAAILEDLEQVRTNLVADAKNSPRSNVPGARELIEQRLEAMSGDQMAQIRVAVTRGIFKARGSIHSGSGAKADTSPREEVQRPERPTGEWHRVRSLTAGGQGEIYLVEERGSKSGAYFVQKRLKNATSPNVSQGGRGAAKSSSIRQRSELNIRKSSYGPSPADLLAVLSPNVSIFCQGKTEHSPNRPAYPNSSGYSLPFSSAELRLATAGAPGGTAPGKDSPSTATPRPCVR